MEKIIRGIMRYRVMDRKFMVKQFQQVRNNPAPKAVFYTCMDARMIPAKFTETNVGDMFVVRNVGNIVPHADHFEDEMTSCEPAALELGCVMNNIEHVVVCGHADCNAMNLLYTFRNKDQTSKELRRRSALRSWLYAYATETLDKFVTVNGDFSKPFLFTAETPDRKFTAYIDPENKFELIDKLSQVNTLQQLQNVASYEMLKERFRNSDLHVHALWFDIYTGDIYYFSRHAQRFIVIDETSYEQIVSEVRTQGQNL